MTTDLGREEEFTPGIYMIKSTSHPKAREEVFSQQVHDKVATTAMGEKRSSGLADKPSENYHSNK
jgi:hypothetical protein